jgi:uncharacterized repeat protein (TIGR02543 family)
MYVKQVAVIIFKKEGCAMKKTFFAVALFTTFIAVSAYAQSGVTTRYWDACKPSCGWNGNISGSPNGLCKSCDISGAPISGEGGNSSCQNGPAFTCMKQAPWRVDDNLSYGFVANNKVGCGKCVELSFTNTTISGKKMIVMVSNFGNLSGDAHFDIMIPGGGVGDFDALTRQIQQGGGNNSDMGARYGGFRAKCGANESCIRDMCDKAFGTAGLADLKAGCYWYIDWFKMADNPNVTYREVTCPEALVTSYKNGTGGGGGNPTPPTTPGTYTLTTSANPSAGGSVTRNNAGPNYNPGTSVTVTAQPAANYTFTRWEGASTATTASVTVTMNSNLTLTAVFTQNAAPSNCNPSGRRDTIKVEAEAFTSKVGNNISTEGGILGYIESGYSVTYNNVNVGKAGQAIMQFRLATEVTSNFTVKVNNANVGTISQASTGGWGNFQMVPLGSCVTLNAGANTIALEFQSAVNIDNFLLIGDIKSTFTSTGYAAKTVSGRSSITLSPARNGFNALLPADHGYTSYKLIDILGREIKSGNIGAGVNDLSVGGLKHSVFFLKLEGTGKTPAALKVVTY